MARERTNDGGVDADLVPSHTHGFEHEHKPRRARKLALLLAITGGALYLLRRSQRHAEIEEGVWHEASSS